MNKTGIDWCSRTWNPMTGCLHGCPYCYARKLTEIRSRLFPHGFTPMFHPDRLGQPGKVRKPHTVFVGSMTDMMGAWWKGKDISRVVSACAESPRHTFLWLTKNPARYASIIWPDNCWLGTTVTGPGDIQNIATLLHVPDVKRFISIEPMHGPVDFKVALGLSELRAGGYEHTLKDISPMIHQVILGGETGDQARPVHPDWVRAVRDQCAAAEVPFFFKGWGEWFPVTRDVEARRQMMDLKNYHVWPDQGLESPVSIRAGKKEVGRKLDEREHLELAWGE